MRHIISLFFVIWWVLGITVAKGFWLTVACLFPLIGWVVATDWLLNTYTTCFPIG